MPAKGIGEKLQPRIVPEHDELSGALGPHLRQPRILRGEARRRVALVDVQDRVEE